MGAKDELEGNDLPMEAQGPIPATLIPEMGGEAVSKRAVPKSLQPSLQRRFIPSPRMDSLSLLGAVRFHRTFAPRKPWEPCLNLRAPGLAGLLTAFLLGLLAARTLPRRRFLRDRYVLLHGGSSLDLERIAAHALSESGRGRRDRRQVLRTTGVRPAVWSWSMR